MNFATVRMIARRRTPERRARDHAARILRRRGDRIAMALLERGDLEPNTNYRIRSPRAYWSNNMRAGLAAAFINDPTFAAWGREKRHEWADLMMRFVFPINEDGRGWSLNSATDYGLGLHVTMWRQIGEEIAKRTAARLAEGRGA